MHIIAPPTAPVEIKLVLAPQVEVIFCNEHCEVNVVLQPVGYGAHSPVIRSTLHTQTSS